MGFDAQDKEIVKLLTKLKTTEAEYPRHLLTARREHFLRRMGEIELGIAATTGTGDAAKNSPPASPAPVASTLLETILVVAIIAEASAVAYFYRDRLAGFLQRVTSAPRVEQTSPAAIVITAPAIYETMTPAPVTTSTALSPTGLESPAGPSITATATPVPGFAEDSDTTDVQLNSTPALNLNDGSNGNNGNHYGQTPKPERTKENNGNNDKPPQDNNQPPPKDNSNPPPKDNKDEPKPTKSK